MLTLALFDDLLTQKQSDQSIVKSCFCLKGYFVFDVEKCRLMLFESTWAWKYDEINLIFTSLYIET